MKKQTAVEWLAQRAVTSGGMLFESDVQKALQMEREQIVEAYSDGVFECRNRVDGFPPVHENEYFEKTYGK